MSDVTDAARELWLLLEPLPKAGHRGDKPLEVMAKYFKVDIHGTELTGVLHFVRSRLTQVKTQVLALPDIPEGHKEKTIEDISILDKSFSPYVLSMNNWDGLISNYLRPEFISRLDNISWSLHRHFPFRRLTKEDADHLCASIGELLDELGPEFDSSTKIFLTTLFGSLRRAIQPYPYIDPQEICERAVFAYNSLNGKFINKTKENAANDRQIRAVVAKSLAIVACIIGFYVDVPQLRPVTVEFWWPIFDASVQGLPSFAHHRDKRMRLPSEEKPALPPPRKALPAPTCRQREAEADEPS